MKQAVLLLGIFGIFWTPGVIVRFDSARLGTLPPGWKVALTHSGAAPKWETVRDATAPSGPEVLAQVSADKTPDRFPLAIYEQANIADGDVSVYFKPVSGTEDRSGGFVWRYRDRNNYYLVRGNAIENNVVLYKVENGKRTALAPRGKPGSAYVKHDIPAGKWSLLHVSFRGTRFRVYFDHTEVLEVDDSTFAGPGKLGLWTKADSVTYFDNFEFKDR